MASAEERPAGSGRWMASWYDGEGRRRRRSGFQSARAARRYGEDQEDARGQLVAPACPTWSEWCARWWPTRVLEDSTQINQAQVVRTWIAPYWSDARLDQIRRSDVASWIAQLELDGASRHRVAAAYKIFSGSLRAAVDDELLAVNPAARHKLPPPALDDPVFFTRSEVDAIEQAIDARYRLPVQILIGCGLRWGELAGLTWNRVDLAAGRLDVVEVWSDAGQQVKPYPKGRQRRSVPIPAWLVTVLAAQPERRGLVARSETGARLDIRNFRRRHFMPARRRAGIERGTIHDLRHTYASWLVQSGVSLEDIAEVLGHSSVWVTQRYAHLGGTHAERVRAVMDSAALAPSGHQTGHRGQLKIIRGGS